MKVQWSKNLHDNEGHVYEDCVLLFCGEETILKFKNVMELEDFVIEIKHLISYIKEQEYDN